MHDLSVHIPLSTHTSSLLSACPHHNPEHHFLTSPPLCMPCTVSFPTQVHALHGDTTKMPSHLTLAHPTLTSATASVKLPDDNETDLPVWLSPRRPPASPAFPSPASRASAGGCPRGEPPTPRSAPSAASPRSAQTPTWRTGARCGCLVLSGHGKSLQLTPHLLSDKSL